MGQTDFSLCLHPPSVKESEGVVLKYFGVKQRPRISTALIYFPCCLPINKCMILASAECPYVS